ncbi:C40 family peptidase [Aestuariimicrobium kwangyangense]|uniref:C40 family peptidase n=1 Tax=Aestuariimicrobium kwangyangense TaxID=396389 RepID=UPI0003B6C247|nr:NlpC/P60 family protein [Aestuariimicrobium kwangyangense]
MSKLRNTMAAAAASLALGAGMLVAGPVPNASAAVTCTPSPANIHCSMYWANRTTYAARYNARNYYVHALQRALTQAGFAVGDTGHYNTYTVTAVKRYQSSRGLTVTGALNYKTLRWMRVGAGPVRPALTKGQVAVKFAYAQIGKPYAYGATGPSSYDCSGLTGASWKSAGLTISRTSQAQLSNYRSVSRSSLQPGDIVGFYSGSHVSIYVGSGYVIHSSRPGKPVSKVAVSSMPFYKAVRPVG